MNPARRRRLRYIRGIVRQGPTETAYAWLRARRRRRNVADEELALLPSDRAVIEGDFDLDPQELRAHSEALAEQERLAGLEVRRVHWLVPAFQLAYQGGIHTILRFADGFKRLHGAESSFTLFDSDDRAAVDGARRRIGEAFPALAGARVLARSEELPACDVAIASAWESAYRLARMRAARSRYLFVQDWEPDFHPAGSLRAVVEQAGRLGFPGIVNTPALAGAYRDLGNAAVAFTPAIDRGRYRPPAESRPDAPVRIFFYGRPYNVRNAFALGLETLRRVKREHGDAVEIVSAGEDWSPGQYGVGDVLANAGMLDSLDEVAELYRGCHVGLVFMLTRHPSYQPLEFMASGMATVSNESAWTGWLLRDGENALLAPPVPALVAERIGRLVRDRGLRERIAAGGLETVARGPAWDEQIELVWDALTGATAARPSAAPRG
jgi:O-antigen biosynthesis protein